MEDLMFVLVMALVVILVGVLLWDLIGNDIYLEITTDKTYKLVECIVLGKDYEVRNLTTYVNTGKIVVPVTTVTEYHYVTVEIEGRKYRYNNKQTYNSVAEGDRVTTKLMTRRNKLNKIEDITIVEMVKVP